MTSKPVLIVTIPNYAPRCYCFDGEHVRIGRSDTNHLRLDEQSISNTHCEFVNDPKSDQWIFRDLGSTNGSKVNGHPVGLEALTINDGDELLLGNVVKLHYLIMRPFDVPEALEEEDENTDVNPVAAAVARQARKDMEGTQMIKLKADSPRKRFFHHKEDK
ncbi:MAG: FHA domain-containing protein [Verrucomicrobiales bacterium]|nr:FHA domain-containing protein [Verrucomicrobiales bacterium]